MMTKRAFTTITDIGTVADARGWQYRADPEATAQTRYVDVSRTLPEEALDMLYNMARHSEDFYAREWKSADFIAQKYFARLYSVSPEPMGQGFTCEIPDVTLLSSYGVAISAQGDLLAQSTIYRDLRDMQLICAIHASKPSIILPEGLWVSLQSYSATNYSHWMNDCLTRLMLIDTSDPELRFIVPADARPFHFEFLSLLGIDSERLYQPKEIHPSLHARRFLLTHGSKGIGRAHVVLMQRLRDRLWARLGVTPTHTRRLYLSRAKATRPVVNEAELVPILEKNDFELFFPEDHSVSDQIRMFADAAAVAGVHSSGLYNIQFCKPGARLLEIYNRQRWEISTSRIASLLGHQHWHLYADNLSAEHKTHIDPEKFERWLRPVFSQ